MKSFYDYNLNSPQERHERDLLYPELAKFHIALREELSEDEYHTFYKSEKDSIKPYMLPKQTNSRTWSHA